jgi:short-subunit dehydrogenase
MGETKQDLMQNRALVTGSGQGIGWALAESCAKRGIHVILVALPNENLFEKAKGLSEKYNIEADCFETDLSIEENCVRLFNEVISLKKSLNILINNAGLGSSAPFEQYGTDFYNKQIRLNINALVLLTRLFIPVLRQQPHAHILNTGSLGGFFYMPNKEVYAASKSFVYSFSRSLRETLYHSNISVTVLCPGPVDSNQRLLNTHKNLKGLARKAVMQPSEVAELAIPAMLSGKKSIIPGKINRFLLFLNRIVPSNVKRRIIQKEMKRQETIPAESA